MSLDPSDPEQFRRLFDAHFGDLWRFARRRCRSADDADDVTAQVFAVAWRRRDELPAAAVRLWLFGVARRMLANHRRSNERQHHLQLRLIDNHRDDDEEETDQTNEELGAAFASLSDDDLLYVVGPLDPAGDGDQPAPGSDRYRAILAFAMRTDLDTASIDTGPTSHRRPSRGRRRHSWLPAGIAAATLTATAGFLVVQSRDVPTAQAVVSDAAEAMAAVTSLEGETISSEPGVNTGRSRIRVDGDDVEIVRETRYAEGRIERSTFTVTDGIGYETIQGRTTRRTLRPDEFLTPFGQSSEAVISAALEGSNVSEQAEETVDGVATTRYDIRLSDESVAALSALTPNELAWFELEYPDEVHTLSVWVADDLVQRIEIVYRDQVTTRARFFNFDGNITITAPPGPYLDSMD